MPVLAEPIACSQQELTRVRTRRGSSFRILFALYGNTMSGERRRAMAARCLAGNPKRCRADSRSSALCTKTLTRRKRKHGFCQRVEVHETELNTVRKIDVSRIVRYHLSFIPGKAFTQHAWPCLSEEQPQRSPLAPSRGFCAPADGRSRPASERRPNARSPMPCLWSGSHGVSSCPANRDTCPLLWPFPFPLPLDFQFLTTSEPVCPQREVPAGENAP